MQASIIIPTSNKIPYLTLTLAGLAKQTVSSENFEIIIVNDGTSSIEHAVISAYRLNGNMQIKIVDRRRSISSSQEDTAHIPLAGNVSATRNIGIKEASTDLCIFLDDDMIPCNSFVENHIKSFKMGYNVIKGPRLYRVYTIPCELDESDRKALLHSGNPRLVQIASTPQALNSQSLISPEEIINDWDNLLQLGHDVKPIVIRYFRDLADLEAKWILTGSHNIAYQRSFIESIGGFDENFKTYGMEDLECGYRALTSGANFIFNDAAMACHQYHFSDRRQNLISSFHNWKYFRKKHNAPDVWLWFAWHVLRNIDIIEYNNLLKGLRAKDPNVTAIVNDMIKKMENLMDTDIFGEK